ncbi:type IV secretory system conjugative DNA transfer family protein [Clostridium sp.]|uniref:type IV secretory system conjugative DNA transfer family protein n=1 Tax=Clostridium sp. TaxID=1506 RepID=UPI003F3E1511
MEQKYKQQFQKWVDRSKGKTIDKVALISMIVSTVVTLFLYFSTYKILFSIEIAKHSKILYSLIIVNAVIVFYMSMLGDKVSKPVNRPKIYLFTTITIAIATYSLLAEEFNSFFVGAIETLVDMTVVPLFIVQTNSKILTILVPFIIIAVGFYKSMTIAFKKEYKSDLQEYKVDWLTRNVEELNNYNVDCKICEDFATGESIYLTEKQSFRHMLVAGNSGAGKTSLVLRPYLAQLFNKKSFYREELKMLTLEALEEGLCYINVPVTNKYINDNFSMDLISINPDKKDRFKEKFNKLIIGERESEHILFNDIVENGRTVVNLDNTKGIKSTTLTIRCYLDGVIDDEIKLNYYTSEYNNSIARENFKVKIDVGPVEIENEELESEYQRAIVIELSSNSELTTYEVLVTQESEGKMIYKNTGVTTIAPDGGLREQTLKIAAANGVKVHKIDPKMEEIKKGNIAKYNPLMLGDPEKTGDIIASILTGMEDGEVNPYYKNAGIRAIRNIVILLRVMYPIENGGSDPTLEDVLELLNDFGKVETMSKNMSKDENLKKRWKSVIEYFEASFYEIKTNEKTGIRVSGTNFGIKRAKTQEAVAGIINQLDNFIGREEIRYILCSRTGGLNLDEVLEGGECIAIATRQAELGDVIGRAFALFFIMSLQTAVLSRYSEDEAPEIPYEIVIDEFPFYLNDQSKIFFTFSRKYKCSVTCVIQNIAQLKEQSDMFKEIILTNTNTKVILPGSNVEDRMYYTEMLGFEDVFEVKTGISSTPLFSDQARYMESKSGAITEKNRVSKEKLATLEFKNCYYSVTDTKGKLKIGKGTLDFLKLDENNTTINKEYDFRKYLRLVNDSDMQSVKLKLVKKVERIEIKEDINFAELISTLNGKEDIKFFEDGFKETKTDIDNNSQGKNEVKDSDELKEERQSSDIVPVDPNELSTDEFANASFPEFVEPAVAESTGLNVDKVNHKKTEEQPEEVENNKDDTSKSKVSCSEKVVVEDKLRSLLINLHKKLSALGADPWDLSSINNLISYEGKLERVSISKEAANNIHLNSRTDNLSIALVNKKSSSDVLLIYRDEDNFKVNKYIETKEVDVSYEYIEKDDFINLKIKSK